MRNGVASIVPLFLGIVLLFSFMIFMGGGSDTLHTVSKVEHLQHLQAKLIVPALRKRDSLQDNGAADVNASLNKYINVIMVDNKIQKPKQEDNIDD